MYTTVTAHRFPHTAVTSRPLATARGPRLRGGPTTAPVVAGLSFPSRFARTERCEATVCATGQGHRRLRFLRLRRRPRSVPTERVELAAQIHALAVSPLRAGRARGHRRRG